MKTTFLAAAATGSAIAEREPFSTITMSRDPRTDDEVPADIGQRNPHVKAYAKQAGITMEDVRKHGACAVNVLPNLRELVDATAARGR